MVARILTIAGSDSSGGAGIQADIKSIMAMDGYAMTAITAVTAQNTCGVSAVETLSLAMIEAQIRMVMDDIGADAIKTGMLATADIVQLVARVLKSYRPDKLVVDPVMISTSRARLLEEAAIECYRTDLIPLAYVVTPNIPEAELLADMSITTTDQMVEAAKIILGLGCQYVLVKGGHLPTGQKMEDVLVSAELTEIFPTVYLESIHTHGTGCSLASAIAALIGRGMALKQAVDQAQRYVHQAIKTAPQLGKGSGPINHLCYMEEVWRF